MGLILKSEKRFIPTPSPNNNVDFCSWKAIFEIAIKYFNPKQLFKNHKLKIC